MPSSKRIFYRTFFLLCILTISISSYSKSIEPDLIIPAQLAILPLNLEAKEHAFKQRTLIEWMKTLKKGQQGTLDYLVRTHLAYGLHDRGYTVWKLKDSDELFSKFEGSSLTPDNPFYKEGLEAIVVPKLISWDTSRLSSTGEALIVLQVDIVSTKTGKLLWSEKNKNHRIWDQRNIVAPDIKHYLSRAITNCLKQLPKYKSQITKENA